MGNSLAKFWLNPEVSLVNSYGFNSSQLNELTKVIDEKKILIEEKWNEYFNIQ
jgi:hypothetical protein